NHNSTQIRYSGGIVGYAENTSTIAITNCTNSGTINQNASASSSRCGGIVGGMSAITAGEISNCQNNGTISCTGGIAGGILGYVMTNTSVVTVSNSKNSGSINGSYCGGIVGQVANAAANGILILNDTNTSTITCVSTSGGIVGKIANNVAKIKQCINIGDIVATGNIIGGISGQFDYVNIYGCKNSGNISGPASATKYGGIVGSCGQGFIDSCINTGNLNGGSSSTDANMGGIVGYLANTNDSPTYITNCGNFGNITCKSKAGGIIGYANGKYMHIVNCYNQGNFTISGTYAGGLVGFLYTTVRGVYIKNCYSIGFFSSSANTFAPLTSAYNNTCAGYATTTASYAINTAATNATYSHAKCNPTTTFDGTTGVLTAPQTIDGSSRTTLQSAVSAWQSANTPYETVSIPLSTWTTATLPRLTWE
ncbi:MAG: hypothetical protein II793_02510, partial [Bacteroidales bacterium]|nr:hypothetical protein [Bacteroidales bacterium]